MSVLNRFLAILEWKLAGKKLMLHKLKDGRTSCLICRREWWSPQDENHTKQCIFGEADLYVSDKDDNLVTGISVSAKGLKQVEDAILDNRGPSLKLQEVLDLTSSMKRKP